MDLRLLEKMSLLESSSWRLGEKSKTQNVLVDLMHCHSEFLWRALTIAKSIQCFTDCTLIGMVGAAGVTLREPVNVNENIALARAFGVNDFIPVPQEMNVLSDDGILKTVRTLAYNIDNEQSLDLKSRMQLAELFFADGFPIGRTIYETAMRAERFALVPGGEVLEFWAHYVIGFDRWLRQILAGHDIDVFVTGHVDYCPWGHLSQRLLEIGGRIVYYRCDVRVPINIIDDILPGKSINASIRCADTEAFQDFERQIAQNTKTNQQLQKLAEKRFKAVNQGLSRNWRWTQPHMQDDFVPKFHNSLPTYILFAHTYTDQPMADSSIFIDHADWILSTLEHAAKTKIYNLIIKLHPLDKQYDALNLSKKLMEEFGSYANIEFYSGPLSVENIVRFAKAGITVRGTPGIEMTAWGLPMIIAGDAPYSDLDLCEKPQTKDQYFELLLAADSLSAQTDARRDRAQLFMAYDRFWSAPVSSMIPPFEVRDETDTSKVLGQCVQASVLETDQLTLSLRKSWLARNSKVILPEMYQAFQMVETRRT